MKPHSLVTAIAVLLTAVFIAPSAFLAAPERAHAQSTIGVPTGEVADSPISQSTFIDTVKNTVSSVANWATYINTYYLQPAAFILSGNLMKVLTANVIGFVTGTANGTGVPQFVVSVQKSMQTLSDMKTKAYLSQINLTGSPFASSISSALGLNYLQGSSLAGFWAANMCTLRASSPNPAAYLAGNWSQGGVPAWFALTTQSQNNPYMLYQNSQMQLANVVGGAVAARTSELSWGSGFASWCSVSDSATQTQNSAATAYQNCMSIPGNTGDTCQATFENSGGTMPSGGGINPGDACTNKDGTQGTIQTPGSTIKATLDKVLGGNQDRLAQMGKIASDIGSIINSVGTIWQTAQFAQQILGGGSSGGLLGFGQTSLKPAVNPNISPVSTSVVDQSVATSSANNPFISNMSTRVDSYQAAWNTISIAAKTASTNVTSLLSICTTNATTAKTQVQTNPDLQTFITVSTAQANAAQTALVTGIAPVLTRAAAASTVITAARAAVLRVQAEVGTATYISDAQALDTMSPSIPEVLAAQAGAQSSGAVATPTGSLTVSGGSLVGQMNLISTNATALQTTVCTYGGSPGGALVP